MSWGDTPSLNIALLHRPYSGICEEAMNSDASAYAGQLARYIRDISTIRARTFDQFGCSPTRSWIAQKQAEHIAERERYRAESDKIPEIDCDAQPFKVGAMPAVFGKQRLQPDDPRLIESPAPVVHLHSTPRTVREVIEAVCRDLKQLPEEVLGGSRKRPLMLARRTTAYVLHKRGNSYPQIGSFLGGIDHSSIIHAVRQFDLHATDEMRAVAARYSVRPVVVDAA